MPAADSAAGIARKWEGSVASGPSNQPYQTGLPLRVPDRHDVRFNEAQDKWVGENSLKSNNRWVKAGKYVICHWSLVIGKCIPTNDNLHVLICAIKKIESGPNTKIGIHAISAGQRFTRSALGGLAAN